MQVDDEDDDEDDDDDDDDDQGRGFERESDDDIPRGVGGGVERNLPTRNATEDGVVVSAASAASLARLRTASSSPELTQMAPDSTTLRNRHRRDVGGHADPGSSMRTTSSLGRENGRRHHGTVSDVTSVDALDDVVSMWRR